MGVIYNNVDKIQPPWLILFILEIVNYTENKTSH